MGRIFSPMEVEVTVHLLVEKDGKILFVKNKPEPYGKPGGYGLPGGSILIDNPIDKDLSFANLSRFAISQIKEFMAKLGIPSVKLDEILSIDTSFAKDELSALIYLTAIREGIEETGLLFRPISVKFDERVSFTHRVVVVSAEIVDGTLMKDTVETDDAGWFDLDHLPEGTYRSHIRRLTRILRGAALYV